VAGAKGQSVAHGGQAGQAFDLDDEAEQIGDGAADPGGLDATQTGFAGVDPFSEITASH
jgi:hypothetical protein